VIVRGLLLGLAWHNLRKLLRPRRRTAPL
jgi:hypothetical protein